MKKGCKVRYQIVKYEDVAPNQFFPREIEFTKYYRKPTALRILREYQEKDFANSALYGLSKTIFYPSYVPKSYEYIED